MVIFWSFRNQDKGEEYLQETSQGHGMQVVTNVVCIIQFTRVNKPNNYFTNTCF